MMMRHFPVCFASQLEWNELLMGLFFTVETINSVQADWIVTWHMVDNFQTSFILFH